MRCGVRDERGLGVVYDGKDRTERKVIRSYAIFSVRKMIGTPPLPSHTHTHQQPNIEYKQLTQGLL